MSDGGLLGEMYKHACESNDGLAVTNSRLTAENLKLKAKIAELEALFNRWESTGDVVAVSYAIQAKIMLEGDK